MGFITMTSTTAIVSEMTTFNTAIVLFVRLYCLCMRLYFLKNVAIIYLTISNFIRIFYYEASNKYIYIMSLNWLYYDGACLLRSKCFSLFNMELWAMRIYGLKTNFLTTDAGKSLLYDLCLFMFDTIKFYFYLNTLICSSWLIYALKNVIVHKVPNFLRQVAAQS